MKKVVAVMSACIIAAALIVALLAVQDKPAERNETVGKSVEGVASVVDEEGTDVLLKTDEPEKHVALQQADYDQIKKEIAEPEYRKNVKVAKKKYVVIRKETDKSGPIEDENWYKKTGAKSYQVLSSDDAGNDEKIVSYEITTGKKKDIWAVIDKLNQPEYDEELLITEPVYYYYTCDEGQPSEQNNPGMSREWYLEDQKMSTIWGDPDTYGDASGDGAVVAVIDTGVDYTHEDLTENMWMNTAELTGQENVDDDNNGYVDDIYGVSFIDNSSDPQDDNGHGTHVAGIIAMEDNETGGAGIAYKAKIMAIKAGGSDGSFNSTDIKKALDYARANKADVINMSFGGYGHSAIVENGLRMAFSTSVLVAAAGNDGFPTADSPILPNGNMYPASYSYVLGVMAIDRNGKMTDFSNYDWRPNYGAEYEVAAPGKEIYSTLPGNRYASWSGTSMATPVVSAAAAIIRSTHPDKDLYSSRYIMGQIASATEDTVSKELLGYKPIVYARLNLTYSITKAPKPNIYVNEVYMFDDPEIDSANNGNGIVEPGETIDLAIGLRNQWGAATDVYVTANATSAGGVDNRYVTFTNGKEVRIDDIGTFGTQDNGFVKNDEGTIIGVKNPIRVKISENAPNDANIQFNINYHAKNALDKNDTATYVQCMDTPFTLSVQKGTVLKGKIESDITLTKDNYYIIENALLVPKGVTVNVEAGTKIQFWSADSATVYATDSIAGIQVNGVMNFLGTKAEPIELFPGKDYESFRVEVRKAGNGIVNMDYVNIINPCIEITKGSHLNLTQDYDRIFWRDIDNEGRVYETCGGATVVGDRISNSTISNLRGLSIWERAYVRGSFDTVQFDNCQITYEGIKAENCAFLMNQGRVEDGSGTLQYHTSLMNNSGNAYRIPEVELASDIKTYKGKKYVIYRYDWNPFGFEWENGKDLEQFYYPTFKALMKLIERNGGSVSYATEEDDRSERNRMLADLFSTIDPSRNCDALTGVYFDREKEEIVIPDDPKADLTWYNNRGLSKSAPFIYMYRNTYIDGDGKEVSYAVVTGGTSGFPSGILAEYPEDTDDYKIMNLNVDLEKLGILENTYFKNNAILNRLTSKNTDDWMKLSANGRGNDYILMAQNNYWGTKDEKLIQKQLIDFDTNIRWADYIVEPYLDAIPESAYPAVSDIYILDKNGEKVTSFGSGDYEVHVFFNRDMDTSVQPWVTYGPDDPYTDYQIKGDFVSPKEWVGSMNIRVQINQGNQYFRVQGAVAADDPWLVTGTDWGRFTFNIEATGAEALILQGAGGKGCIDLTWTQDDYDTLAGYNVYRSLTGEEGSYKKVNSSIITADTMEFTDRNVSAGKRYYYYFTVVDTSLKESKASNIVISSSIDDEPPRVSHNKAKSITLGINASITATITDNVAVNNAVLFYRMQGDSEYTPLYMTQTNENTYSVQIPAVNMREGILEYYIEAYDSETTGYGASEEEPYTVPVEVKAVITSVANGTGEVGKKIEASIKGLNFSEDMKVRIDGEIVESTFVSSKQIDINYEPKFIGKKRVELMRNNMMIASLTKAVSVSDPSIKIFNMQDTIILGQNSEQRIMLYSNFEGKMERMEISYYDPNYKVNWFTPIYGYNNCEKDIMDNEGVRTIEFTMTPQNYRNGQFGYFYYYNLQEPYAPEIRSIKINGVEVENINLDKENVAFISKDDFIPAEAISVDKNSYEINIGDNIRPEYTVIPTNATDSTVSVSATEGLKLNDDGTFTAIRSGWQYIYLNGRNVSNTINVYVKPIPVSEVVPKQHDIEGMVGDIVTVSVDVFPVESDGSISWWQVTGSDILEFREILDNGRTATLRFKKAGTATIGAHYSEDSNIRGLINVTIKENTSYVDIQDDIVTLTPNETFDLSTVIRNGSEDQQITWSSSNVTIASVENGRITARGKGAAVITASLEGGVGADSVIVLVGTDSMEYMLGDVNLDGKITSTDAMLALKLSVCGNCNDVFAKIADVNGDGEVTSSDAMMILQYVTGKIKYFE